MRFAELFLAGTLAASSVSMPARSEVELEPEQRANLGIRTEAIQVTAVAQAWPASAQVLDVAPLIAIVSDLRSAETAAVASRGEAERMDRLYRDDKNVARKALDAAQTQAAMDQAKVTTTKAQLLATWGRGISSLSREARAHLVSDLLEGRASLVRAEQFYPLPRDSQISQATLSELNGKGSWPAQWLGPLSQPAGATLAGASLLRVAVALSPGEPLMASLVDSRKPASGPSVPASAIIRYHGAEWAYEETSANHFERRAVRSGMRSGGRALLEGDVAPNRSVVTVGARMLLAAELGASEPQDAAGAED
ncbi:MAG: hypothetical protein ABI885_19130 [Gammaproteobacteria bacterium]